MRTFQATGENTLEVVDRPVTFLMTKDAPMQRLEDDYLFARIKDNYTLVRIGGPFVFERLQ